MPSIETITFHLTIDNIPHEGNYYGCVEHLFGSDGPKTRNKIIEWSIKTKSDRDLGENVAPTSFYRNCSLYYLLGIGSEVDM